MICSCCQTFHAPSSGTNPPLPEGGGDCVCKRYRPSPFPSKRALKNGQELNMKSSSWKDILCLANVVFWRTCDVRRKADLRRSLGKVTGEFMYICICVCVKSNRPTEREALPPSPPLKCFKKGVGVYECGTFSRRFIYRSTYQWLPSLLPFFRSFFSFLLSSSLWFKLFTLPLSTDLSPFKLKSHIASTKRPRQDRVDH